MPRAVWQPTTEDGARIWRSLLAFEADSLRSSRCVGLSTESNRFGEPQSWQQISSDLPGDWGVYADSRSEVALARYLHELGAAVGAAPRPWHRLIVRIDPSTVPKIFLGAASSRDCPRLVISSPLIFRDMAFAAVAYRCEPLCGYGHVIALRRRGTDWQVVARKLGYIS